METFWNEQLTTTAGPSSVYIHVARHTFWHEFVFSDVCLLRSLYKTQNVQLWDSA